MQHHLSPALRNTGHGAAADELDRLLTTINNVVTESSRANGRIDKLTHFKLLAITAEQSLETSELCEAPL